jgi:hypothetical protein
MLQKEYFNGAVGDDDTLELVSPGKLAPACTAACILSSCLPHNALPFASVVCEFVSASCRPRPPVRNDTSGVCVRHVYNPVAVKTLMREVRYTQRET